MEPIIPPRSPRPFGGWLVIRTDGMRIGDHERDAAAAALAQHYAHGRLSQSEHEERMTGALNARTNADLHALFADLPRFATAAAGPAKRSRSRSRQMVRAIFGAIAALIALLIVVQVIVAVVIVVAAIALGRLAFASHRRRPIAVQRRAWRPTVGYRGW